MKYYKNIKNLLLIINLLLTSNIFAQNPIITDQFSADPTARVFDDKVYVYPSHDILAVEGKGRIGWFCMPDYHVFSSSNLTDWKDHGVIVSQTTVPWVNPKAYAMWAPDCISRNGKYYFYFPAPALDTTLGRGFSVGVAIADNPQGPFTPEPNPIKNLRGIDPNVFIDKDDQAYIYWAGRGGLTGAKLKDNMLELDSEPTLIKEMPKGFKEGPFVFERKGIYYFTFPYVKDSTETLAYAIGDNPLGPFEYAGIIMDESPIGCWTNHHSVLEYQDQWYLFYHHNDFSPNFDKRRSVRADSLFFNEDGTIEEVIPTFRGIGITDASIKIQMDRYSFKSDNGATIELHDTVNTFKGWKTILASANAWIQYNSVQFGNNAYKNIKIKTRSMSSSKLNVRIDKVDGQAIAQLEIPKSKSWEIFNFPLLEYKPGVHNLIIQLTENKNVEIDWISFE